MLEFRTKMGEGGRVVIPSALRNQLQIKIGEELTIRIQDNELRLCSIKHSLKRAQDVVRKYNQKKNSLVNVLITARRKESKNE